MRQQLLQPAQTIQPSAPLRPEDILTPAQLAERLQVNVSWVFEQTRNRAKVRNKNKTPLPCIRMGKYLRFSWASVSEWLLQSKD
jgi:hypothetical protein